MSTYESQGIKVTITQSAGEDGAMVVFVDTEFEPNASDGGPGLRVLINDHDTYIGVPYAYHPDHTECADGCGLAVTHDGACRDKPGGRIVCEHEEDE